MLKDEGLLPFWMIDISILYFRFEMNAIVMRANCWTRRLKFATARLILLSLVVIAASFIISSKVWMFWGSADT